MKGAFYAIIAILLLVIFGSLLFLLFGPAPDQPAPTSEIAFGEAFRLRVSNVLQINEATSLVLEDILQDSRCPIDSSVQCVWEGTVVALISTTRTEIADEDTIEEVHETFEIELGESETALGNNLFIELLNVSPEQTTGEIDAALYELTFVINERADTTTDDPEPEQTDLVLYFSSEMERRGTEILGGFPIEGYGPFSYLNAFGGLIKTDFEGADALQGIYKIQEGELLFVLEDTDAIHSAAETLSKEGMETLLNTVSVRLGLPVNTATQIDSLIEKIK